jgi:hypothetical protein
MNDISKSQSMKSSLPSAAAALRRLQEWDGLGRLDEAIRDLRTRPNIFTIAPGILRVEGIHSDMLAWLLEPKGWHGLQHQFAQAFVRTIRHKSVEAPVVLTQISREFNTGFGPVDLLLRGTDGGIPFVVAVENKIDSPESDDQLERYRKGLARLFDPSITTLIYLTPDGREPARRPKCQFACLSYASVAASLDVALTGAAPIGGDHTGRALAEHYLAALRSHIMPDSNPEIDEICRRLYQEHQEAWRAIRRRLPSRRDESHSYLGAQVCERLELDHGGSWNFAVRRDRFVCVFRPGWRVLGIYEAEPIVGLEQGAASFTYPFVHFRLVADRSDVDAGERFQYQLRLKVSTLENRPLTDSVIGALRALPTDVAPRIPDRSQFTVALKTTNSLPGVGDGPASIPGSVVEWVAHNISPFVSALEREHAF